MANMPLLRITQQRENADTFHVEVAFEGPRVPRQTVTSKVIFGLTNQEHEQIRWYLEDYLQFPQDPSPTIAGRIEQRMAEIGKNLFKAVFHSSKDARDLWATLRSKLNDTRVSYCAGRYKRISSKYIIPEPPANGLFLSPKPIAIVLTFARSSRRSKTPLLSLGS